MACSAQMLSAVRSFNVGLTALHARMVEVTPWGLHDGNSHVVSALCVVSAQQALL